MKLRHELVLKALEPRANISHSSPLRASGEAVLEVLRPTREILQPYDPSLSEPLQPLYAVLRLIPC